MKSRSYAVGAGLSAAMVGEAVSVTLHTLDSEGLPCIKPIEAIQCELTSDTQPAELTPEPSNKSTPLTPDENCCSVRFMRDNVYEIAYTPIARGKQLLHIKVEGKHTRGSPFPILVKLPLDQLGSPVRIIQNAVALAVTRKGHVIMATMESSLRCLENTGRGSSTLVEWLWTPETGTS